MNASFEQPPSSPSELAAGAVALGVVALITIVGVSTSPPSAVSPSVASVAPATVAREPDNVPTEPAGLNSAGSSQVAQASQPSEPGQDGPTSIASGTTVEIPIVTPSPAVGETPKRAQTADSRSIENSSPAPASEPAGPGPSHTQPLEILHAPPAQHQSRPADAAEAPRVEAYIGTWAREPADCRNRADDQRIRIDARGAESWGGRCTF